MPHEQMTIQEMARKAGVSVATISRTINPGTRKQVAPETLKKIDALIQKYGYTPNQAAQNLKQTSYKTLGVLFPHHEGILQSEYYSSILSGAADSVLGSEYHLKMILLKPEKPHWDYYDFKNGESIDGLIVTYWRTFFTDKSVLKKIKVPCVVINNIEEEVHARFIAGDHFEGGRLAAHHLWDYGHRRIAVISGTRGTPDAEERFKGFVTGLKEKGVTLPKDSVFDVNFEEAKSYELTDQLLKRKPAFTACFCMNDCQAHGILKRLAELGVSCPKPLSLMGYDDERRSAHSNPPLSTVQVPVYEMTKTAVQNLIGFLKGSMRPKDFYRPVYFPVSLIPRKSVQKI